MPTWEDLALEQQGWVEAMVGSLAGNAHVQALLGAQGEELQETLYKKFIELVEQGDPISLGEFGASEDQEIQKNCISPENTVVNVEVEEGNVFLRAYDAAAFYQWEGEHGTDPITRKPVDNFYIADGAAWTSTKGQEIADAARKNAELKRQMDEAIARRREELERQRTEEEVINRVRDYTREIKSIVRAGRDFRDIDITTEILKIAVRATARWDNHSMYTVKLAGANVSAVDFTEITTSNIDFTGTKLTRQQVEQIIYRARLCNQTPNLAGADLSGVDLSGLDLHKVNFTGANLEGTNFTDAKLYMAKLENANLKDVIVNKQSILNYQGYYLGRAEYFEANKHNDLVDKYPLLQAVQVEEILFDKKRGVNATPHNPTRNGEPHLFIGRDEVTGANSYQFYSTLDEAKVAGSNKIWAATIPSLAVAQTPADVSVHTETPAAPRGGRWVGMVQRQEPASSDLADYGSRGRSQGLPINRNL